MQIWFCLQVLLAFLVNHTDSVCGFRLLPFPRLLKSNLTSLLFPTAKPEVHLNHFHSQPSHLLGVAFNTPDIYAKPDEKNAEQVKLHGYLVRVPVSETSGDKLADDDDRKTPFILMKPNSFPEHMASKRWHKLQAKTQMEQFKQDSIMNSNLERLIGEKSTPDLFDKAVDIENGEEDSRLEKYLENFLKSDKFLFENEKRPQLGWFKDPFMKSTLKHHETETFKLSHNFDAKDESGPKKLNDDENDFKDWPKLKSSKPKRGALPSISYDYWYEPVAMGLDRKPLPAGANTFGSDFSKDEDYEEDNANQLLAIRKQEEEEPDLVKEVNRNQQQMEREETGEDYVDESEDQEFWKEKQRDKEDDDIDEDETLENDM